MAHENTYQRKELKYLLSAQQYSGLMHQISPYITPDLYGKSTVNNIYCDTPDWELARRSIEKPEYKEKLRLRGYGTPGPDDAVFLELKKKYKGTVYKRRFCCTLREAMLYLRLGAQPKQPDQVFREIDYTVRHYGLQPMLYLAYDRLAFCGKEDEEFRLTFDASIRSRRKPLDFSHGSDGVLLTREPMVLLEVKAALAMPVWMRDALTDWAIYPASFSKYGEIYTGMLQTNTQHKESALCSKAS